MAPGATIISTCFNSGLATLALMRASRCQDLLEAASAVALDDVVARRTFQLDGREINGHQMEMSRIDTVVGAGTTELWTIQEHA